MTTTSLKLLALLLMLCDHIGEFIPGTPIWLRWIGRLSAPLFLFCMVWGFHYTRNRKTYLLRMYVCGAGMGILNLLLNVLWPGTPYQYISNNIFVTLLLIGIIIWIVETIRADKKKGIRYLLLFLLLQVVSTVIFLALLWWCGANFEPKWAYLAFFTAALCPNVIYNEGSILIIALGVLMYFTKENQVKLSMVYLAFCALCLWSAGAAGWTLENVFYNGYQWMMVGSLPLMLLYNEEKGKGYKYLFYGFYPAHIFLLFIIGNLMPA